MDIHPKSRGRVAWSANPLDDEPQSAQRDGDVAAAVAAINRALGQFPQDPLGAYLPRAPQASSSPYSPYSACASFACEPSASSFADGAMPADFDLMPSTGRSNRLSDTPRERRHVQGGLRRSRHQARPDGEPEALRLAWANWYASHQNPYGHHRVAANLRVKEVELLRALQGDGVHALRTDLGDLLAPLGRWGRVVIELHHPLGLASVGLAPTQVQVQAGQVLLIDPERQFALGMRAFAECFLVHGAGAFSLLGFDDAGDVVARVHLVDLARGSQAQLQALSHLLAHALVVDTARPAAPAWTGDRLTQPGWCVVEQQLQAPEALARLCHQLSLALDTSSELNFMMESEAAILACQATPIKLNGTRVPAPQQVIGCRLGLRAANIRRASVCTGSDERVFLRLSADYGHCLRFQHPGTQAEARVWIESLLSTAS